MDPFTKTRDAETAGGVGLGGGDYATGEHDLDGPGGQRLSRFVADMANEKTCFADHHVLDVSGSRGRLHGIRHAGKRLAAHAEHARHHAKSPHRCVPDHGR
jgi:hypothetical protein